MKFSAQRRTVVSSIASTTDGRRIRATLPALALPALVLAAAFLAGGYYESTYSLLAAVVWLGIACAGALRPPPAPSPAVRLLAALAVWTALSALWGPPGVALRTWPLVALYAGALWVAEWTPGLTALRALRFALELVVLAALVARCAGVAPTGGGQGSERLTWPVTYANGLGLVAVLGVVLTAGLPLPRPRLAAGACALFGATAYLTFSRSALLAGVAAAALLAALRPSALRGIAGAACGIAAVGALDAVASTDGPVLVPALVVGAAAASALPPLRLRVPRRLALAAAVLLAVAAAALAQPLAARFAAPAPDERNAHRLLDVSGHGRTALWRVAVDEARDHPLLGGGAGTWPRRAAAEIGVDAPANAHSLYLETLAELGPLGLALLAAALAALAARAAREPAALAVVAVFAVHAAVDWDWQLPAVTVPVLAVAGAAAGPRARRIGPRVGLAAAGFALVVGVAAGAHGLGAALVESGISAPPRARAAASLLPWDARPWAALAAATRSPDAYRRACRADRKDLVLTQLPPPFEGCRFR